MSKLCLFRVTEPSGSQHLSVPCRMTDAEAEKWARKRKPKHVTVVSGEDVWHLSGERLAQATVERVVSKT